MFPGDTERDWETVKKITPAIGRGERDVGDLRVLLSGVPGVTDRGWLGYFKNAWEAVTCRAGKASAGEAVAASSIRRILNDFSILVPGHDTPFTMDAGGVKFLTPFRWEIKISLYPEGPEQTVASLYPTAGHKRA